MRERQPVTASKLSATLGLCLALAPLVAGAQSGSRGAGPMVETIAPPPPSVGPAPVADPGPLAAPAPALEGPAPIDLSHDYGSDHILDIHAPALTESSGTLFNRGWWYTRMDLVFLQRTWKASDTFLAFDTDADIDGAVDGDPNGTNSDDGDSLRVLRLQNSGPNREESARLTLGRFLFRDIHNRDHTAEMTYFGGGDFAQDSILISDNTQADNTGGLGSTGRINVPFTIDRGADASFDGAARTDVSYDSRFNTLEWNYVVTSRLPRDRMELLPSGDWVRRANVGWTYHALFGLRYFDLTERVRWRADSITNTFDIAANPADGLYRVRTENDAFGPQFGAGVTYQSDRASITFGGKIGALANNVSSDERLSFTDTASGLAVATDPAGDPLGFTTGERDNTLAFLGTFEMTGRWRLRPHLSLRAGYELMLLTAVGLAPDQLQFNPSDGIVVVSGDSFYHGVSMGIEGYW